MELKKRKAKYTVPKRVLFAYGALLLTLIGMFLGINGVSLLKFLSQEREVRKEQVIKQLPVENISLEFTNTRSFRFPSDIYIPGVSRKPYGVTGVTGSLSDVWESIYKELKVLGCSKRGKYKFWTESTDLGRVYVIFSDGVYIVWLTASDNAATLKKQIEDFSFKSLNKVAKIKCKDALETSENAKVKFLVCTRSTKNGTKWEDDAKYKICVIKNTLGQQYLVSWKLFAKEKERIGCKFR